MREFETRVQVTKSLSEVAGAGYFLEVQKLLRSRFIPHFDPVEYKRDWNDSLEWLKNPENTATFVKTNDHPENRKYLPLFIQASPSTLSLFLKTGWEAEKYKNSPIYKTPVAYSPGTKEFAEDIHSSVYPFFKKLKDYDSVKTDFKLERKTDKKTLAMISKFYYTIGYAYRNEATDAVSSLLFANYWEALNYSARIINAPEKRLVFR